MARARRSTAAQAVEEVLTEPQTTEGEPIMSDETQATEVTTEATTNDTPEKRDRRLKKDLSTYPGKVALTVYQGAEGEQIFDPNDLPANVQALLPAFALGHKLGDAAAGKEGPTAEAAIKKTWEGMLEGNWTVRIPAEPKVSLKDVTAKLSGLSEEEQKVAADLLRSLGIVLPGLA